MVAVLAADERVRAADIDVGLTGDLLSIAAKRLTAGDVTALDVNAAKAETARARAEAAARSAELEQAMATLKAALGLAPAAVIELRTRLAEVTPPSREALLAAIEKRPEIRRLRAQVERARAELQLARSQRLPEFSLRAERHEEEDAVAYLGGIRFTLPIFERGQDLRITGTARLEGAERALAAIRQRIIATSTGAFAAYEKRREAADLERDALAPLADNERLSRRAYEVGEINLAEFLAFRQQTVAARREYIDRLADAAVVAVDLRRTVPAIPPSPGD